MAPCSVRRRHLASLGVPDPQFQRGGHLGLLTHERRLLRLSGEEDSPLAAVAR
jgi:hypothetical protein